MLVLICSCQNADKLNSNTEANSDTKPVYAERFSIEVRTNYTRLLIKNPWQGAHNVTQEYFLIKRGNPIPEEIDTNKVIFIPLEKIVCFSTTHVSMISALNSESTIVAVSGVEYIYNNVVKKAASTGKIRDVGYEDNLNKELILDLAPDLVMVYGIGSESAGYLAKLSELGIRVLFNADYLETDPLGKAEWIKVIGSLYAKDEMADSIFNSVAEQYNSVKSLILNATSVNPTVLLGLPWKDTWYISPGNSYVSALIQDAGGRYLWDETESEMSMPYGLENVFLAALSADYWLNTGNANNKSEIIAVDNRLEELQAFKNGQLFNNNKRVNSAGGNDYWESGSINPHIVLKDLALILHPELFDGDTLVYYKKIK